MCLRKGKLRRWGRGGWSVFANARNVSAGNTGNWITGKHNAILDIYLLCLMKSANESTAGPSCRILLCEKVLSWLREGVESARLHLWEQYVHVLTPVHVHFTSRKLYSFFYWHSYYWAGLRMGRVDNVKTFFFMCFVYFSFVLLWLYWLVVGYFILIDHI